jgi:thioredoxin 1
MQTTAVTHLNESNFDQAIAEGLTLVDFWAEWCGPCRMQAPVLDALAEQMGATVQVAKVNVEESPRLAGRFRVSGIPLLVILKDGQEVERLVGLQNLASLVAVLKRHGA